MYRIFLASLVLACVAVTSVQAVTWNANGSLDDWLEAGLLRTDLPEDNSSYSAEILRYGATVQDGMLYAVVEIDRPLADFSGSTSSGKTRALVPGIAIDVDRSSATYLASLGELGVFESGCDIALECPINRSGSVMALWGDGGNFTTAFTTSVGMVYGVSAPGLAHGIVEWACPITTITGALASLSPPYNVTGSTWNTLVYCEGNTRDIAPIGWGRDYAVLTGDANYDGACNVADLTNLLNNYNGMGKVWTDGDFTGGPNGNPDGTVNVADLTALLNNYNNNNYFSVSGGASLNAAVPEPSSIIMLASLVALLGAWVIRRR